MKNPEDFIQTVCREYSPEKQFALILQDFTTDIIGIEIFGEELLREDLEKIDYIGLNTLLDYLQPEVESLEKYILKASANSSTSSFSYEDGFYRMQEVCELIKNMMKFSIICRVSADVLDILLRRKSSI